MCVYWCVADQGALPHNRGLLFGVRDQGTYMGTPMTAYGAQHQRTQQSTRRRARHARFPPRSLPGLQLYELPSYLSSYGFTCTSMYDLVRV